MLTFSFSRICEVVTLIVFGARGIMVEVLAILLSGGMEGQRSMLSVSARY